MAIANVASAYAGSPYGGYGPANGAASQERQETGAPAGRTVQDSVAISAVGRLSAKALTAGISQDIDPRVFQARSAEFQGELGNRFRAAGIDTTRPIELTVDSTGQVRVANDHPDKAKIEALFAGDTELSNEFRRLSASYSLMKAVEAHLEFAKAYAKDPKAAVAQFSELFSGQKYDVQFRLAENEWVRTIG